MLQIYEHFPGHTFETDSYSGTDLTKHSFEVTNHTFIDYLHR